MIVLSLAWQQFTMQWQSKTNHLWLLTQLSLAFYLFVITLTGSTVQQYLADNLQHMIGADTLVTGSNINRDAVTAQITPHASQLSYTKQFSLTLTHQNQWQPVEIKAVDDHYPLRGEVVVANQLGGQEQRLQSGPAPGNIWLDSRAISGLGLQMGDAVVFGSGNLTLSHVLQFEPDRLLEGHSVAMRGMIHLQDYRLLPTPDKVTSRFLVQNNHAQQLALEQALGDSHAHLQVISAANGRHPLAALWQRVEKFFGLSAVLLFLIGAVAIDMTSNNMLKRQKYFFAVAMSCGMTRAQGMLVSILTFVFGVMTALVPAALAAMLLAHFAADLLQVFFADLQSNWRASDILGVALLCFLLFTLNQIPSWLAVMNVKVLDLLQERVKPLALGVSRLVFPLLGIGVLIGFYSDNLLMTSMLMLSIVFCLALIGTLTWLTLGLGEKLVSKRHGLLSFTFYLMRKRLLSKSAQIIGLGLSLMLFIFCLKMVDDFTGMLESVSRKQNGNLFISQANQTEIDAIHGWAEQTNSDVRQLSPFVYAELTKINNQAVHDHATQPSQTRQELSSSTRLSWHEQVPDNNALTQGNWDTKEKNESEKNAAENPTYRVSVEDEVAEDLNLSLGDVLTFVVNDQPLQFAIASIHQFKPGTHSVTFWFVVQTASAEPPTFAANPLYMGSMELPQAAWDELATLWQAHPSLRMMPLKALTERIDKFSHFGLGLLLSVSVFVSLLSSLVIFATAARFVDDDKKRNGLMLSFGLDKKSCLKLVIYEWLITAVVASGSAILATWFAGELLYKVQFGMDYKADVLWMISTLLENILGLTALGLFLSYASLNVTVLDLLAERPVSNSKPDINWHDIPFLPAKVVHWLDKKSAKRNKNSGNASENSQRK